MDKFIELIDKAGVALISKILYWRTIKRFEKNYGHFLKLKNYKKYQLSNLNNESSYLHGEIVKMIYDLPKYPKRVLLDGENNTVSQELKNRIKKTSKSKIVTTGLGDNVDVKWNFEEDIPRIGKFDLIISQSIIEHLVNPYKHIKDLSKLLRENGYLIVQTVLPGFGYHRYSIDTLRFYPDWFEEMAKVQHGNLKVVKKYIRDNAIFYLYKKAF